MTPGLRRMLTALAAFALLLVSAYLGVSLYVAARLTAPANSQTEPPASANPEFKEVGFESTDGVALEGWWRPGEDAGRAVVLVHGWGGDRSDEHVLRTADVYADAGYAVLMPDLRGHGGSEDVRRSLGDRERRDVRAALAWVQTQGFDADDTVLHGFSMGAAAALGATPGSGVSMVVAEAGYADLPLLLQGQIPAQSGLPRLFTPGILLASRLFLGLDPDAVRPREEAARLAERGVPLFIIHSEADEVVPFEHARLFQKTHPDSELWRLEGYAHVEAYTHPQYETRLLRFLQDSRE